MPRHAAVGARSTRTASRCRFAALRTSTESRRGFWCRFCCSSKGASLVASTRGAAGGYRLARPPHEISLAEVIEVMEGDERPETNAGKATPLVGALLRLLPRAGRRPARPAGGYDAGRPGRAGRPARADVVHLNAAEFCGLALPRCETPTRQITLNRYECNHGGTENTESVKDDGDMEDAGCGTRHGCRPPSISCSPSFFSVSSVPPWFVFESSAFDVRAHRG